MKYKITQYNQINLQENVYGVEHRVSNPNDVDPQNGYTLSIREYELEVEDILAVGQTDEELISDEWGKISSGPNINGELERGHFFESGGFIIPKKLTRSDINREFEKVPDDFLDKKSEMSEEEIIRLLPNVWNRIYYTVQNDKKCPDKVRKAFNRYDIATPYQGFSENPQYLFNFVSVEKMEDSQ
jgi:hypothetical protein